MSINDNELKKLEKLSKFKLDPKEIKGFLTKINSVKQVIDILQGQEINCDHVEPLRSVSDDNQRMRDDKVEILDQSENLFKNTPKNTPKLAKEIKCFVVPKVIE